MHQLDFEAIRERILRPGKIVIIPHQRPDGDAIGSSLGLYHYLRAHGHEVTVITPSEYPPNLQWMPGNGEIVVGPEDPSLANKLFDEADAIFFLDLNDLKRIDPFTEVATNAKATKILMDHHPNPKPQFDFAFWDDSASSTAEMVARLIDDMKDWDMLGPEIATCLYAGILTDTGSFRFPSTTPNVHRLVARLMEAGADANQIYDHIYANDSERRLRLFGHCLSQRLYVLPEYHTAYIMLTKQDVEQFQIGSGDTEGLVNYCLSLRGINFGVFMIDKDNQIKMSFRSRGDFAANEVAAHFNGGGHFHAAGGRSYDSLETTQQKFLDLLEKYQDQLTY